MLSYAFCHGETSELKWYTGGTLVARVAWWLKFTQDSKDSKQTRWHKFFTWPVFELGHCQKHHLVGGIPTPLKNVSSSVGVTSSQSMEK